MEKIWNIASQSWVEEQTEPIGEIIFKPKFDDVVYSEKQKVFMQLILERLKQGERRNLLFSGMAGTGKTFSSKMIACETGKPFIYLNGAMSKRKIINLMRSAKDNAIILIDEIHNLPEKVAEIIYSAVEDNEIYDDGVRHLLKNMTFIGTTTEPERLPKPLQDRFMKIEFEEPDEETMQKILNKMGLDDKCVGLMINYTLNIRILKKLIEYMKLYGDLTEENLVKVFRLMKINIYNGLSDEQEKYVDYLKKIKKASLRNLSLVLRRSENYIKLEIEPDLIRKSMLIITSRGRELAPEFAGYGYEQLEKERDKSHSKYTKDNREVAINWLKEHEGITEKLGKRYLELVDVVAEMIANGEVPDTIDFESFSDDVSIRESKENNYENVLEEL